eukprot:3157676-Rhodomonas_salina.2
MQFLVFDFAVYWPREADVQTAHVGRTKAACTCSEIQFNKPHFQHSLVPGTRFLYLISACIESTLTTQTSLISECACMVAAADRSRRV